MYATLLDRLLRIRDRILLELRDERSPEPITLEMKIIDDPDRYINALTKIVQHEHEPDLLRGLARNLYKCPTNYERAIDKVYNRLQLRRPDSETDFESQDEDEIEESPIRHQAMKLLKALTAMVVQAKNQNSKFGIEGYIPRSQYPYDVQPIIDLAVKIIASYIRRLSSNAPPNPKLNLVTSIIKESIRLILTESDLDCNKFWEKMFYSKDVYAAMEEFKGLSDDYVNLGELLIDSIVTLNKYKYEKTQESVKLRCDFPIPQDHVQYLINSMPLLWNSLLRTEDKLIDTVDGRPARLAVSEVVPPKHISNIIDESSSKNEATSKSILKQSDEIVEPAKEINERNIVSFSEVANKKVEVVNEPYQSSTTIEESQSSGETTLDNNQLNNETAPKEADDAVRAENQLAEQIAQAKVQPVEEVAPIIDKINEIRASVVEEIRKSIISQNSGYVSELKNESINATYLETQADSASNRRASNISELSNQIQNLTERISKNKASKDSIKSLVKSAENLMNHLQNPKEESTE